MAESVLISGAGIAGPTLAYWLDVAGFETTIVERASALRTGGYVIDFWGPGYGIVERMGLATALESAGYHIQELRIVGDRGEKIAGFGVEGLRAITGGGFITVPRSDLSRLLFDTAAKRTEVLFDDQVATLRDEGDKVRVEFECSAARSFDLVVGADGLHSNIRRLVFGPQRQFETDLGYAIAAFETVGYRPRDEDVYVLYNWPGVMIGRVALREDRTLFLFIFADKDGAASRARDLPAQKAALRARYGNAAWECAKILARLDDATDLYFDRVSQIRMEAWSKGRVALVGDAAFCVSLAAGQGSALAVTAAYTLAGELLNAKGGYEAAFRAYESCLRSYLAAKQKGAERYSAAFAPHTRWGLNVRNLVANALATPGLGRFVIGRSLVDTLALPDYPWPDRAMRAA